MLSFPKNPRYIKKFTVNEYLSLALTRFGRTIILIKDRPFHQCMYLLFNIVGKKDLKKYHDIKSIDEMAGRYDQTGEHTINEEISPEEEFKGHCSNLHAFFKHDYDTRLLHRNLAFPLLRALLRVGDPLAKDCYAEEMIERFKEKYYPVQFVLTKRIYMKDLEKKDLVELKKHAVKSIIIDRIDRFLTGKKIMPFYKAQKRLSKTTILGMMKQDESSFHLYCKVIVLRGLGYKQIKSLLPYLREYSVKPSEKKRINKVINEKKAIEKKHITLNHWF